MLIYEKNNELNIQFDPQVGEEYKPDLIIQKENDQVNVKINGENSTLPKVTADENGKTLVVKNGNWEVGESSGGGSGGLVVSITTDGDISTLDKTWQEIYDVISKGGSVILCTKDEESNLEFFSPVSVVQKDYSSYDVISMDGTTYKTNTTDGYPHHNGGIG